VCVLVLSQVDGKDFFTSWHLLINLSNSRNHSEGTAVAQHFPAAWHRL